MVSETGDIEASELTFCVSKNLTVPLRLPVIAGAVATDPEASAGDDSCPAVGEDILESPDRGALSLLPAPLLVDAVWPAIFCTAAGGDLLMTVDI